MNVYFWNMNASNHNMENYYNYAQWDHEPTQEEINEVRVKLSSQEYKPKYHGPEPEPEDDEEVIDDCVFIRLNNKKYISFIIDYDISRIELYDGDGKSCFGQW